MAFFRRGVRLFGSPVVAVPVASRTAGGNGDHFATDGNHTLSLTLRVLSVGGVGPSLTVTIQHSLDEETWRDHTSFPAVSAAGSDRLVISALDHFWRVAWAIAGTAPSFEFGLDGSVR